MVKISTQRANKAPQESFPVIDFSALQSVIHTDDVVDYTLRCVLALTPRLEKAVIEATERHVREIFGGDRLYVSKKRGGGTSERNSEIRMLYARGERISFLERKFSLTTRQIRRIIGSD